MIILSQSLGLIFILYSISNFIFCKLKISDDIKSIYGLAFFSISVNFLYFILRLDFKIIFYFYIFLFLISLFFFRKENILNYFKILNFFLPLIVLFLIVIYLLGPQHYIFRGNIWDNFAYISQGALINNFNIGEIINLENLYDFEKIENFYLRYKEQIYSRPLVGFVIAILNNLVPIDPFDTGFSFKIFSTLLTFSAIKFFLESLLNIKKRFSIFLSLGFILSHFYFYNYEIDAFSLILSFPFLILLLNDINLFDRAILKKDNTFFLKFVILSASFFIIYPNSACIFLFLFFLYFIYKLKKIKILNYENIKYLLNYLLLFFILTLPSFKSTFVYLFKEEIVVGLLHKIDFWGYYGAFALGKMNPIHSQDAVDSLKQLWLMKPSIKELANSIIEINLNVKNNFFYLNLLPSIFGFFHLTTSSNNIYLNYLFVIVLIYLNFIIFYKIFSLLKFYKSFKNNIKIFYFMTFLFYVFFSLLLIILGQYWSLIKLFFFFSPIFYIFVVLNFSLNSVKVNLVIILFLIFLPIYKYSKFNYGIGILDSYPSIIRENLKKNVNWQIEDALLKKCSVISFEDQDHFKKIYISLKFNYLKKNIEKKHNLCEIKFINKNFVIKK